MPIRLTSEEKQTRLVELLREALRTAPATEPFTLASGKTSQYFIDGKQLTLQPEGLAIISALMLEELEGTGVSAVGGLTLGADPIVAGVVLLSHDGPKPLRGFIVRKEAKDHGMGDAIAGPSLVGVRKVAIVEDVTTTGGSAMRAVEAVRQSYPGVGVARVLTVVDREDGAAERFADEGIDFVALCKLSELTG